MRQVFYVFGTFTQRRELDMDDVQPVVEIFSKSTPPRPFRKIVLR
jgi:hypothetical protein